MNIAKETFNKIVREFKSEISNNTKSIKELNDIDYEHNKKIVEPEELIETIRQYENAQIIERETKNNIVIYYGNPYITIQVLLESIQNNQKVQIVIQDMCYAVNKFIVELFINILKDYRITDMVTFENYKGKEELAEAAKKADNIYFIGNKNTYTMFNNLKDVNIKYIPFYCLDIYCEDDEYEDFAREILNYAIENGYEAEIHEAMPIDIAIKYLNQYGNGFSSLILSKNEENIKKFKQEAEYEYIFANENPFKVKIRLGKMYI